MSIADQLNGLAEARREIEFAIVTRGVEIPPGTTFVQLAPLILQIDGAAPTVLHVTNEGQHVTVEGEPVTVLSFYVA